jgi:hypothetical protein
MPNKRKATEVKKEEVEEEQVRDGKVGETELDNEMNIVTQLPAKKAQAKGKTARVDNSRESKDKEPVTVEGNVGKVTKAKKATKVGKAVKAGKVGESDKVKGATVVDIEDCHHMVRALVLAVACPCSWPLPTLACPCLPRP